MDANFAEMMVAVERNPLHPQAGTAGSKSAYKRCAGENTDDVANRLLTRFAPSM
jgi:hypothetical protein